MVADFPKLALFRQEHSRALESYICVEQSLAMLFSNLLGTEQALGGIAFFRHTNADARNKIIEALLKRKFGGKFHVYWHGNDKGEKGLFSHLSQLTIKRNELVHWSIVNYLGGESRTMPGPEAGSWRLEPPNWWDTFAEKPFVTTEDMQELAAKGDYVQHCISMFRLCQFQWTAAHSVWQTWQGIFEQPFLYPPPELHPSHARWKARKNPHPPFRM